MKYSLAFVLTAGMALVATAPTKALADDYTPGIVIGGGAIVAGVQFKVIGSCDWLAAAKAGVASVKTRI